MLFHSNSDGGTGQAAAKPIIKSQEQSNFLSHFGSCMLAGHPE